MWRFEQRIGSEKLTCSRSSAVVRLSPADTVSSFDVIYIIAGYGDDILRLKHLEM